MKKQFTAIFISGFMILNLISCKEKDDYDTILKDTPVKKEFAINSPVAREITLQLLDEPNTHGNFRMTADLKGQLTDEFLAYEADDQKVVLRDDGKGADSLKGDGIFSAFVTIDTNEVKNMVNDQNASIQRAASTEANMRDVKNIASFLRFNARDSTGSRASHALLLNNPKLVFENRQVKFVEAGPRLIDIAAALRQKAIIHIFPPFLCPPPPADLIPRSLMINDITVVEDISRTWNPVTHTGNVNGAWTFNNIINQMANKAATGVSATQFVLNWLQTWQNPISLNEDNADVRPGITTIINNWKQRSAAKGLPADTLDMGEAPVKLLAIVNRVDLRENVGYSSSNAGEGRFVFCLMGSNATAVTNSPQSFTIIFEYGINRSGCNVRAWGQQWYNLHTMIPGDPSYNTALQAITDQFVNANTNPSKPNGSSLNQIRTDEIAIGNPWQLREFNIDAASHVPVLVTVKKTPRNNLNNTAFLASFINANCAAIEANHYKIEDLASPHILGIISNNNNGLSDAWNAAITCSNPATVRQVFSINTCNACHGVETATGFTHVHPVSFGSTAGLSGFLIGENITDPVSGTPETIADLDDRARKLQFLVCFPCKNIFLPLVFRPLKMVH